MLIDSCHTASHQADVDFSLMVSMHVLLHRMLHAGCILQFQVIERCVASTHT